MAQTKGERAALLAVLLGAVLAVSSVGVFGQEQQFQFVVSALDANGQPVTDLTTKDIVISENDMPIEVLKVEPFRIPVRLTLTIDNGPLSQEPLSHYRAGLEGLVNALPEDVEVTVITTAPQPRRVVRATKDRAQILRGINGFGPQNEAPRFTDSLVEFSKLYQDEFDKNKRFDSIPVLVAVSTTATEQTSYQVAEVSKALTFLRARKARVYVVMISARQNVADFAQIDTNRQALIAIPATEATGGTYEALAISNRLTTLLPEWGEEIAAMHRKYVNQTLVTIKIRAPLQNPRIELARESITGEVSLDGMPTPPPLKQ